MDRDLINIINLDIIDLLLLDIDCPLAIHVVDSDEMGLDRFAKIIQEAGPSFVIGTPTAKMRHKIAYHHGLSIDKFSLIVNNEKSELLDANKNRHLILWDYLNIPQPVGKDIIYQTWDKVDLIVVLKNLVSRSGDQNFSLHNLIMSDVQ
jgi:hypothetical protein